MQFVVADAAGNIVVFEQREGRFVKRSTLHDPPRVHEPGEPQNYGVAWPADEHIVSLDRAPDGFCTYQRRSSDLSVTAVVPSRDNHGIASGGNGTWVVTQRGEAVDVLNVPGLETLLSPTIGTLDCPDPWIFAVATDPRGNLLAASSDGGRTESFSGEWVGHGEARTDLLDVASRQTIAMIPELAQALAFDPWRQQLVFVSNDVTAGVKCYSYAGAPLRKLQMPPEGVSAVAVTREWIITGTSGNGTLSFWAAETLEHVATVPTTDPPKAAWIVPSPDGTRFLTQAADHAVRVWEIDATERS